ncbi:DUF1285 domain-containing protein [Marinobacter alexandrii]|uniref:DUF1285 domain-containing protein n=1 Tax=Marinobacter alexandrii TaxID=2570351 RepID=UPI001108265C|nr:DUF1285 domain-containing protein [Marinobacter alexandrii]
MSQNPETIANQVGEASKSPGHPPLDQWQPELSGDMDLRVTRDGQWIYKGEPLAREAIVRLFSTILRLEDDGEFYLVTPVEKWRIQVDDAPLLAHSLTVEAGGAEQVIKLTTNVGEVLEIGEDHPLDVGRYLGTDEPRPIIHVRHGVTARLVTAAFYDLAEHVVEREGRAGPELGVFSNGNFYKIG